MEMNLREWLIIAGLVIILGILVDGYRRVRRARRDSMEMSLGMGGGIENTPLDNGFSSELPNGGARVIRPAKSPDLDKPAIYPSKNKPKEASSAISDSEVPVLVDIETTPEDDYKQHLPNDIEHDTIGGAYSASALDDSDADWHGEAEGQEADAAWGSSAEPDWDDTFIETDATSVETAGAGETATSAPVKEAGPKKSNIAANQPPVSSEPATKTKKFGNIFGSKAFAGWNKPEKAAPEPVRKGPSEVIVVHVMSKRGEGFNGMALRKLLEACGLEHGEMSIFHRHEDVSNTSPIQFSVANSVEPGFFDLDIMDTITTPGISFFISLPGPVNSMQAFDYMIETAQCVVRNLDGELKDEKRSIMTPQTIEHFREKVREFERKQLSFRR
jgi:cell division protein ZipA